jgi:hypothetical protein
MEAVILILGFCAILTFVAFRNQFFGLKLIAGMSWFGFIIWFINSAITGFEEGTGARTAIIVISIGFGLMIILSGLFRGIQRTDRWSDGSEETHTTFKTPTFITNITKDENSPKERQISREKHRQEYEDKWDRAYRNWKV